jgi:hypothetical protein
MPKYKEFLLKEEHIKLLKGMYVGFNTDMYDGAPAVDIKRPYGNKDIYPDMIRLLGWKQELDRNDEVIITKETFEKLKILHQETAQALEVVLTAQTFEPGLYVADEYKKNWRKG